MSSTEGPIPQDTTPAKPQDDSSQSPDKGPWVLTSPGCHVSLTYDTLSPTEALDLVRSPRAGALVLFAGTTRDNFEGRAVKELQYSAYVPRALRTMLSVAEGVMKRHDGSVVGVAIVHRLGVVPVGEESILIAVASAHRAEGWRAGEEALEEVKDKVEVWKLEEFHGGEGVWRANRDGQAGVRVDAEGQQAP
ncbi:putative polysaccharide deacetylase [Plectosphaerella plurivora]|uniref:Molybdopterin synthase catalytic subunit n=1 Tax=Plectosphaerella plurivora TaxID=936078 RepID=A0A9P9ABN5_9PEZI|nr:putative polysaccharide deacetylase [Plectosphaerella plurivora]